MLTVRARLLLVWMAVREFFRPQYVVLWDPCSPGGRIPVKLTWWRKLSSTRRRYHFATLSDSLRYWDAHRLAVMTWDHNEFVAGREEEVEDVA